MARPAPQTPRTAPAQRLTAAAGRAARRGPARLIAWSAGGRAAHAACQAVMLIAIVRLAGPSTASSYILSLAVSAPVFMLLNMDLRSVLATERGQIPFNDYWAVRCAASAAAASLTLTGAWLLGAGGAGPILIGVVAHKTVESLADILIGRDYQAERVDRVAQSYLVRGVVMSATVTIALALSWDLGSGLLCGSAACAMWLMLVEGRRSRREESPTQTERASRIKRLVVAAAPLGVVGGLGSLASAVPRYCLGVYTSDEELAAFGCCAALFQLTTMAGVAAQQAVSPRLAKRCADQQEGFRTVLRSVAVILPAAVALSSLAVMAIGDQLLGFAFGNAYRAYQGTLAVMMAAACLFAARGFLAAALTSKRQTGSQAIIAACSCSAAIALGPVIVPANGAFGAALLVLATAAVSLLLHLAVLVGRLDRPAPTPIRSRAAC